MSDSKPKTLSSPTRPAGAHSMAEILSQPAVLGPFPGSIAAGGITGRGPALISFRNRVAVHRLRVELLHCAGRRGFVDDDHGHAGARHASVRVAAFPRPGVAGLGRGRGGGNFPLRPHLGSGTRGATAGAGEKHSHLGGHQHAGSAAGADCHRHASTSRLRGSRARL